ncbi:hypothetical protein Hypma_003935 [Hypsizygus marmoreus]|uniref:Nephrocystin 3-like N-terminal domain-containing protein n=1 Tax=Hypsizygus marmoreus TaxID=39966 RepID=A0A369J4Y1_HYPMA|nr:hypothetical protein Hypma_003935 [Hypsizygus marmoreus]
MHGDNISSQAAETMGESCRTSSPPPWAEWTLDKEFFDALSQWSAKHPETLLDRVLDNVRNAIDKGQPFLGLIPGNPFPARGLVEALAHLVQLGATVKRAKTDVYDFATEIVRCLLNMKAAFETCKDDNLTWATWRNLGDMRDLINEICIWSNARLKDRRWSRVGHGLTIAKEIDEFRSRITHAQKLFHSLSMINLAEGMDAISRELGVILQRQDALLEEIDKSKQDQADGIRLTSSEMNTYRDDDTRRAFLADKLASHTVANPTYDQQGKQPCDEGTRVEVLANIIKWIEDTSDYSQNFLWLTGDPGCGKSAITASIARECKDRHILWAQFFINRNNVDTTDPNSYFPTIARQLADLSTDVQKALYDSLRSKPSLVDIISPNQAATLFTAAVGIACDLDPTKPVVVVIDGFDETDRQRLADTAFIFSQLFKSLQSHKNAKILISSRTEDDIRTPFACNLESENVRHLHLDTASRSSIRDVSQFLRRKISELVEENDLKWDVWPGEERMVKLADRACGLFIWAVTAIKFLQGQIDAWGTECLSDVLDTLNNEGMAEMNNLYNVILRLTYQCQEDPWAFETFRRIVGAIAVLQEPLCLSDLESLLNLRRSGGLPPVDIPNFVRRLRTVLVTGVGAINSKTIPRLHKSFFEFITGENVEPRFRINLDVANSELAVQCFRHFVGGYAMLNNDNSSVAGISPDVVSLPRPIRYAHRFWSLHVPVIEGIPATGLLTEGTVSVSRLHHLVRCSSNGNHYGPLTMTFSPDRSQIRTTVDNHARYWDAESGIQDVMTLKGHTNAVLSIAFSPSGEHLASGSSDNTVCIWDTRTGSGSFFTGHTDPVSAVAFSPNGKILVSGSIDRTLRLWDVQTGEYIGLTFNGHVSAVTSVAFSPLGTILVSGSGDFTVRTWDVQAGCAFGLPLTGHSHWVTSVAFSRAGDYVISSSEDTTIRLWDLISREAVRVFKGHSQGVNFAAFSPSSHRIVSVSDDKTIRLWDSVSGRALKPSFKGHADWIRTVAFSPDGKTIASGSYDTTLRIWDADSRESIGPPFTGHTQCVTSVSFSPDGNHIASGSSDSSIRIWDTVVKNEPRSLVTFTAFSLDGKQIVVSYADSSVRIWCSGTENDTPPCGSLLEGGTEYATSIVFSPNGALIAATSSTGQICLWDAVTYQNIHAEHLLNGIEGHIDFTSDSKHLVMRGGHRVTCLWNEPGSGSPQQALGTLASWSSYLRPDLTCSGVAGLQGVRWLQGAEAAGFTAYVDGHIIVARRNGPITIVQAELNQHPKIPLTSHDHNLALTWVDDHISLRRLFYVLIPLLLIFLPLHTISSLWTTRQCPI